MQVYIMHQCIYLSKKVRRGFDRGMRIGRKKLEALRRGKVERKLKVR